MWLLYGWLTELSVKSYACVVAESVIFLQNYRMFETDANLNLIQITNFCSLVAWSVNFCII